MMDVNKGFAKLTKLLLGKELGPVVDYEEWLNERMDVGRVGKSCLTGKRIYVPNYAIFRSLPEDRVVGLESLKEVAGKKVRMDGDDCLREIANKIREIAYFVVEFIEGENSDVVDSALYQNLTHSYKTIDCWNTKYLAYDFFSDKSAYIFGCYRAFNCQFCIHCYNSKNLVRCFEMESCYNCSDSMFCHNCENVRDSLFCSNVKNMRYAVFNREVGQEEYLGVRGMLVDGIVEKLENERRFSPDIFSVGCRVTR